MRIRTSLRELKERVWPSPPIPTILMYHRVAAVTRDPWHLAVSPDLFDKQMAHLRRAHMPLPLDVFVERLIAGNLPTNAVAVTFDDGYRDNLIYAKPILEEHRIPATLFLATGSVGSASPFWWDELAEMILGSPIPVQLSLAVHTGPPLRLIWGEPTESDLKETWTFSDGPESERQTTYLQIWRRLQRISLAERNSTMISLRHLLSDTVADPLGLPMTAVEVSQFASGVGLSLGAHTVSHPALSSLSKKECESEIQESQLACRKYTDNVIRTFSYPYGDMDEQVRSVVEAAGFSCACSTRASNVDRDTFDLFSLPRRAAIQEPLQNFAAKLRR